MLWNKYTWRSGIYSDLNVYRPGSYSKILLYTRYTVETKRYRAFWKDTFRSFFSSKIYFKFLGFFYNSSFSLLVYVPCPLSLTWFIPKIWHVNLYTERANNIRYSLLATISRMAMLVKIILHEIRCIQWYLSDAFYFVFFFNVKYLVRRTKVSLNF